MIYDDNHISIEDDTDVALQRGRRRAVRGLRLARADRRLDRRATPDGDTRGRRGAGRRADRGRRTTEPALVHRPAHDHRLAGAERAEHRQGARRGARRGRGRGHQAGSSASTRTRPSRSTTRCSPTPARWSTAAPSSEAAWEERFERWRGDEPGPRRAARPARASAGCRRAGPTRCPPSPAGKDVATRKASGEVLNALAPSPAGAVGRLGRPGRVQQHDDGGRAVVRPAGRQTEMWQGGPYGRTLHFGIREHAMGSILNGIALHGGTARLRRRRSWCSATTCAPRCGWPRYGLPVIYVWTHDSIGLGEDGPTHQPVEHLAALRAIPGLDVVRPADANETAWAWRTVLEHTDRPGRALPDPAERAHLRPREVPVRPRRGRRPWRLRARRGRPGRPRGDPGRHRLRGAARGRPPGEPAGRGHGHPGGVDAVQGVVRGAGRRLPRAGAAARGPRPGLRRGRRRAGLARDRRRRRPLRLHRALRRLRRLQDPVPGVRPHRRGRGRGCTRAA